MASEQDFFKEYAQAQQQIGQTIMELYRDLTVKIWNDADLEETEAWLSQVYREKIERCGLVINEVANVMSSSGCLSINLLNLAVDTLQSDLHYILLQYVFHFNQVMIERFPGFVPVLSVTPDNDQISLLRALNIQSLNTIVRAVSPDEDRTRRITAGTGNATPILADAVVDAAGGGVGGDRQQNETGGLVLMENEGENEGLVWQKAKIKTNVENDRVDVMLIRNNEDVTVSAKSVAVQCTRIQVKSRVLAKTCFQGAMFQLGMVAESPTSLNSHRYLVFFDDQTVNYCISANIYKLIDQAMDIASLQTDYIQFLAKYFSNYPERPLFRPGRKRKHTVSVQCRSTNEWHDHEVTDTDCSMMMIRCLHAHNNVARRTEWIFRGSPRLHAIHRIYKPPVATIVPSRAIRRINRAEESDCVIFGPDIDDIISHEGSAPATAVPMAAVDSRDRLTLRVATCGTTTARKTTASSKSSSAIVITEPPVSLPGAGSAEMVAFEGSITVRLGAAIMGEKRINFFKVYSPHACGRECVGLVEHSCYRAIPENTHLLWIPIYMGWFRTVKSIRKKRKVEYWSPCGRCITNIEQLDMYLRMADSLLEIDSFTFDKNVSIDKKSVPMTSPMLVLDDISNGKEQYPIHCVNSIDDEEPDVIDYQPQRVPLDGVPLYSNPEFLDGCDCTDGCRDPEKCSCLKKTLEGVRTLMQRGESHVANGYQYGRLMDCIKSGIFECNERCKCDKRCHNRVVQKGIRVPLELYKTADKGWAVRTMHDLPKGCFVCTYTGEVISGSEADVRGHSTTDEYFADIDFLESIEVMKYRKTARDLRERKETSRTRNYLAPVRYRSMIGDMQMYTIDGKVTGNIGRYFNHSCQPNLFVQNVFVDVADLRFPWIAFFTSRTVKAGEELCWDYQYDVGCIPDRKIICKCGSRKCRGRLL